MRAGEFGAHLHAAQPVNRFAVQLLGGRGVAEQRPAAGLQPREIVAGGAHMDIHGSWVSEVACRLAGAASA